MLRLALSTLRDRKGSFIGAMVALACAAALVTACGTLLETGLRGSVATERYRGTPIVVIADQDSHETTREVEEGEDGEKPEVEVKHKAKANAERAWLPTRSTTERLRGIDGISAVVPELSFPAQVLGDPGDEDRPVEGHAWSSARLTPFTLSAGRAPRGDRELVVDSGVAARAGLKVGERTVVQSAAGAVRYTVSGIARTERGTPEHLSALFFSDAEARRLLAPGRDGRAAALGVMTERGADTEKVAAAVEKALSGTTLKVRAGEDRGNAENMDAADSRIKLVSMGGAVGGVSLLVAVLVVVGTFGLSITQRHRELALLRAVAATPRQIRRLIGREALLVGLVAGGIGAAAGLPLAGWLHGRFVALDMVPPTFGQVISPFPPAAAVLTAVLSAWVAARLSGRRAARIRPAEALAESADGSGRLGPVRIIIGLLALAGGITLVLVMRTFDSESGAIPVSQATVILMAMAVALLGPLVTRAAASALRLLPTGRLAPRWLATAQLSASAGRVAQVVSPITLLVAMACTVLFTQDTLGDAAGREAREGSRADRVVVSTGGPGVPHSTAEAIRRTPGTGTVTEVLHTTVRTADLDNFAAQGVTPKGLRDNLDLDVTSGSVEHLGPKDAAVSRRFADTFGLEVGERHAVHLGDGTTVRVRVAAVYERAFGFGDLTLPYRMVARHVDNPLASTVLVQGGTEAAISKTLKQHPGAAVLAPEQVDKLRAEQQESSAMINYLTMGLVLAFTAIAVTNTTAMATSWRTREFALLRLVGATRRQVMRTARWEAAATALLALLLGTGISLAVLSGFGAGMTGDSMPSVPFPQYAAVVAVATVLATVSSAIPTRRALRGNPVDEVNSRA